MRSILIHLRVLGHAPDAAVDAILRHRRPDLRHAARMRDARQLQHGVGLVIVFVDARQRVPRQAPPVVLLYHRAHRLLEIQTSRESAYGGRPRRVGPRYFLVAVLDRAARRRRPPAGAQLLHAALLGRGEVHVLSSARAPGGLGLPFLSRDVKTTVCGPRSNHDWQPSRPAAQMQAEATPVLVQSWF